MFPAGDPAACAAELKLASEGALLSNQLLAVPDEDVQE